MLSRTCLTRTPLRIVSHRFVSSSSTVPLPKLTGPPPPHLLTLADLPIAKIQTLVSSAIAFKKHYKSNAIPLAGRTLDESSEPGSLGETMVGAPLSGMGAGMAVGEDPVPMLALKSLDHKTVALMFNKRSTRTRVASESAVHMLGGHPMFLGAADIQLGVNESLYDTARVVSSMVDGIMARVGDHADVEELAANSSVPVINALSSLYHPTQILADLQTLLETHGPYSPYLASLSGLTIAWIGDSNNILNEMLVTYPRLGINLRIATPVGYELDAGVLERARKGMEEEGGMGQIYHTNSPEDALLGADVVTTDTWISMGQEEEAAKRLKDFAGFQITNDLLKRGGAKPSCLFMHCLPRHSYEVDDEVFYGKDSVVFQEAENRKWTILAVFDAFIGRWKV